MNTKEEVIAAIESADISQLDWQRKIIDSIKPGEDAAYYEEKIAGLFNSLVFKLTNNHTQFLYGGKIVFILCGHMFYDGDFLKSMGYPEDCTYAKGYCNFLHKAFLKHFRMRLIIREFSDIEKFADFLDLTYYNRQAVKKN